MKMRNFVKIFAVCLMMFGCVKLELPENWKEQNVINIENAEFTSSVDGIDPEQTWNVAQGIQPRTGCITIADLVTMGKDASAIRHANYDPDKPFPQYYYVVDSTVVSTKEDVKSSQAENADFFILKEGNQIPIEFKGLDCWAETTLGVYYYDLLGNRIEKELFSKVVGKKYISGDKTEKAKTEGVKTLTLEDGTAFGLYFISRLGPDIDKTYKKETIYKYYSEAELNPDKKSHVKLTTRIVATSTTYDVKTQKMKVTATDVAAAAEKCKEGDEGAALVSKSGYYTWDEVAGSWKDSKKGAAGVVYITLETKWVSPLKKEEVPAYYRYVPAHKEYKEAKDGAATTKRVTDVTAYHTEYTIGFEDSYNYETDEDYNDVELKVNTSIMKGSGRIIASDCDCGPWMILCEDLGTGADNDFNDMIFTVYRTSPTTMKIAYVAGGATRQDYILYNEQIMSEIHEAFGVDITGYNPQVPYPKPNWFINTKVKNGEPSIDETTWSKPILSSVIDVDPALSMSTFYRLDPSDASQGFSVRSEDMPEVPFSPTYKGYSPYMICVPAYGFRWPAECVSIFDAYPEFRGWAEDHTKNVNWYEHPVENLVVDLNDVLQKLGKL